MTSAKDFILQEAEESGGEDSSDEEEEGQNEYEVDNEFTVDNIEEEVPGGEIKKKKKRKRKAKHLHEELDEDDLDLVRENTGQTLSRPAKKTDNKEFKRLKKARAQVNMQTIAEKLFGDNPGMCSI